MIQLVAGIIALLATMPMFARARKANREFPQSDRLPMKFGPSDEPWQEEPRAFALFFMPWLAAFLVACETAFLAVLDAPAMAAAAALAVTVATMHGGQLFLHQRLARYLAGK